MRQMINSINEQNIELKMILSVLKSNKARKGNWSISLYFCVKGDRIVPTVSSAARKDFRKVTFPIKTLDSRELCNPLPSGLWKKAKIFHTSLLHLSQGQSYPVSED